MAKAYDFDVTVTSRHDVVDEQLKTSAIEEVLKLSKYHTHIIDGAITVEKKNSLYKVDISLRVPGHVFVATEEDYDVSKAIYSSIEKTKTQLMKLKSKIIDHRASSVSAADIEIPVDISDEELEQES